MKYTLILIGIVLCAFVGLYLPAKVGNNTKERSVPQVQAQVEVSPTPIITVLTKIKSSYIIPRGQFISQSFNNCGPASLSMLLSMYGTEVPQAELAEKMRPFNNPFGGVDDKSTFPEEFVTQTNAYGYSGLHRANGSELMMKQFVAHDIPVIVRTWLALDDDIGHYRIIKGYDDARRVFIQDDSYQGANLAYSYKDFLTMWKPYNFEYVVVYPKDKEAIVKAIVGENSDEKVSWQNALTKAEDDLKNNPDDTYARFNVVTASYHVGNIQRTIEEFEKVEDKLASKTLWYQLEPFEAYLQNKDYEKLFRLTDNVLNSGNIAYSELYYLRGLAYREQGKNGEAEAEFAKAYEYNKNFDTVKSALKLN